MKNILDYTLLFLIFLFAAQGVSANQCSECEISFRVGGSLVEFDSSIRIDSESNDSVIGGELDFEDDLGLNRAKEFLYANLKWRFLPRHSVHFVYASYSRTASATSDEDYRFGDDVLLSGAFISSALSTASNDIEYRYDFFQRDNLQIGAALGVYWSTREVNLQASGTVVTDGEPETQELNYQRSAKVDIPLPTVGLHIKYQFQPKWELTASVRSLKVEVGNKEGLFNDVSLGLDYSLSKNLSMGAALVHRSLDVASKNQNLHGSLGWVYQGADIFLTYHF